MDRDAENLKEIPLFKNFSDEMMSEFLATFKRNEYKKGSIVFKEKSEGDTLFIIVSGEIVIEKQLDEEGKEFKQLAFLSKGEFFGEMAVLEGQPRFAQARAAEDSSLYEVKRPEFFGFIKSHPDNGLAVFIEIMKAVSKRLQHTSNELTMLFDMSKVLMEPHRSAGDFITKIIDEIAIYFEGSWNINAYLYNKFNDEFENVFSRETFIEDISAREIKNGLKNGWLNAMTYVMVIPDQDRPLGYVIFSKSTEPGGFERNGLSTIFNTISSILTSAIENIEHRAEATLLEKLRIKKSII